MRADSAEPASKLYSARGQHQVDDLQVEQPTLDKTKKLYQQRTVSRAQIPIVRGITSSNFEHRFDFGWGLFFRARYFYGSCNQGVDRVGSLTG